MSWRCRAAVESAATRTLGAIWPDRTLRLQTRQCGDHEHNLSLAATTMRPFTAIGDAHWRIPSQVPLPPLNTTSPLSPSTAFSLPLFMYQTMTSFMPSVVVVIGPVGRPESAAHHATLGVGGEPAVSFTDMIVLLMLLGHLVAPEPIENATWTPELVVYAVGVEASAIDPLATE